MKSASPPKIGIIVSREVSKKAVERNKIKRKIREAIRISLLGRIPRGSITVIRAGKRSETLTFAAVRGELSLALGRLS